MFWLSLFERGVERLAKYGERRGTDGAAHLRTGLRGERAAFFYLRRQGYVVTARRWRSTRVRGDLDLVAWEGDTLCFIEVKTRTTRAVATAEASVDEEKRKIISRLGFLYLLQLQKEDVPVRFDIVSVYFEPGRAPEFELFRGAFGWR